MSLFEAVVALVILGLAGVGFLGAFQTTARSTRNAADWAVAVSYAESAMESSKVGAPPADTVPAGFSRTVDVQPWPNVPGLARVTVTVGLPRGGAYVLERLVDAR